MGDVTPVIVRELPDSGKVLVAHPKHEAAALRDAQREGIEKVLLTDFAPPTHIYVVDMGAILTVPKWIP